MSSAPTLEQAMAAKLLRKDLDPNEPRVKVRIRTFGEGFVWRGYTIDVRDALDAAIDRRFPLLVGTIELEMFSSHADELRAEAIKHASTPDQIARANDDLRSDLVELGAIKRDEVPSPEHVAALLKDGLSGKTSKPYRPSYVASFQTMNRCGVFPILSVEVVQASAKKS